MGWLADLFSGVRPNTEAFKAITAELKDMRDLAKADNKELKNRVEHLEQQVEKLTNYEMDCHKIAIQLLQQNRDLREEIIFLKRLNDKKNG